ARDHRRLPHRAQRRSRAALRHPFPAGRDRRRRVADLQEPGRACRQRPPDLRHLVQDPLAAGERCRRPAAVGHRRDRARRLRAGFREARGRRGVQDRRLSGRSPVGAAAGRGAVARAGRGHLRAGEMDAPMTTAGSELDQAFDAELSGLRDAGTYKHPNVLRSPQGPVVEMEGRGEVLVLSSNNYLGLAGRPEVVEAGIEGLRKYGAGTGSVRFICGTFEPHLELERELADFSGTDASLTYVSCWNANEAVIPSLTDENTVILSDALNHASIIDAIRLSKPARKVIYSHSSIDELRAGLESCEPGQRKLVITDGVFSMEGDLARLPEIVELAREHDAVVVVDDSHGTG